jgi:hypothetical protein
MTSGKNDIVGTGMNENNSRALSENTVNVDLFPDLIDREAAIPFVLILVVVLTDSLSPSEGD